MDSIGNLICLLNFAYSAFYDRRSLCAPIHLAFTWNLGLVLPIRMPWVFRFVECFLKFHPIRRFCSMRSSKAKCPCLPTS